MLRIHAVKSALVLLLALSVPLEMGAQVSRPQSKNSKPHPSVPAKPKLTPQEQVGLSILDQQAGVAKSLSPATRTFALLEIARGYVKLDHHKALDTLRESFEASQTIEEPASQHPSTKAPLQEQIVSRLVELDPAYCEQLIPQLAGSAKSTATDAVVEYHTSKKQFTQAIALLNQLGGAEFPYFTVSKLMQALPPEMAGDRQNLFAEALASYSQYDHKTLGAVDDFAVFISRTWQGLPPDLVTQAIDEVLEQARGSDEGMQITVGAQKGAASFNSVYEYTLFELMPVLRALDPERADRLLEENRDLQSTLKQFPNGLKSLDPNNGTPDNISVRSPSNSGESSAADRYAADLQRQIEQILEHANKDPKQALAAAMSLPDFHNIRALALLRLAGAVLKTSPSYAADALDELMKIIPSIQREIVQSDLLAGAGEEYLKLGDNDSAKKVVSQGFKLAEKLYVTDTDDDDPNQAFKAEWPSTSVWCRFVALATRISPETALQAINSIPDPEIQSLETIGLADALLGAPPGPQMVAVISKSKNAFMISTQEQ